MRIGQTIGKVVLSRVHPSLRGAQFKLVLPLTFKDLTEPEPQETAEVIGEAERAVKLEDSERVKSAVNRLEQQNFSRKWGNELVVYDDCSVAIDEWVAFSEGAEAAAAFGANPKPIDAFLGAILDSVVIDYATVKSLTIGKL